MWRIPVVAGTLAFFIGLPVAMAALEDTIAVPIAMVLALVGWCAWMVYAVKN